VFERKIDGNRPFADQEKLMFGPLISFLYACFRGGKTPNVKWLQDMRGVWRHTEGNNLAFFAQILEFNRLVALVAVNNQKPIATYSSCLCVMDKVL
jgi:hypothetical protein